MSSGATNSTVESGRAPQRVRIAASPAAKIRRLSIRDLPALFALASESELPSLEDSCRLQRSLERHVGFGAFLVDRLVGCCFISHDVRKDYLKSPSDRRVFPIPNAYFFGAFVERERRGIGIGRSLYVHRLNYVRRFRKTIVVELFGDGRSSSVHGEAVPGYQFYLKQGFTEIGYTVDKDGGKVLASGSEQRGALPKRSLS